MPAVSETPWASRMRYRIPSLILRTTRMLPAGIGRGVVMLLVALGCSSNDGDPARADWSPWRLMDSDDGTRTYALDERALEEALTAVAGTGAKPLARIHTLEIPAPEGGFTVFRIEQTQTMSPELQAKFPGIRTYRGDARDTPHTTVRFEMGPAGFRAEIRGEIGTYYVEPLEKEGRAYWYVRRRDRNRASE